MLFNPPAVYTLSIELDEASAREAATMLARYIYYLSRVDARTIIHWKRFKTEVNCVRQGVINQRGLEKVSQDCFDALFTALTFY